jgi:hypothetical protein
MKLQYLRQGGVFMPNKQVQIINRLKSLNSFPGVTVKGRGTIHIGFRTERSLEFKFVWSGDHYIGYFTDDKGKLSQAVLSLWDSLDAIRFASSYCLLIELRASRQDHSNPT